MPITFTTDFGLKDGFAGVMKGVVLGINPKASIVDISHEIDPGNIREAMFVLETSVKYFPKGSIHVAVVDPGVGSGRRGLVIRLSGRAGGFHLVGPDNGIFTPFLGAAEKIISIEREKFSLRGKKKSKKDFNFFQGSTFDGRDVFAPAAAWLSKGVRAEEFGPEVKDPVKLSLPELAFKGGKVFGCVLHVDRFGNCITNIDAGWLLKLGKEKKQIRIKAKGLTFGIADFYLQAGDKQSKTKNLYGIVNSSGLLELFIPGGNASRGLGLEPGTPVEVF